MRMSLDGFVAGPGDGKEFPLGKNDRMRIFGCATLASCASTNRDWITV